MGVNYYAKWVHAVAIGFVVVAALNLGVIGLTGVNLVGRIVGARSVTARVIYVLMGLAAIYVGFRRDTYLPFLGETVMPCGALMERVPDHADTEVVIHSLPPGRKVLYWAAEPSRISYSFGQTYGVNTPQEPATAGLGAINDWRKAYLDFANAGVTTVNDMGMAVLRVRSPQSYRVPIGKTLESHVHWRLCGEGGMLGPVQSMPVKN
jgi:uncharacterized membrane protein YuzA (DUF378 family)